MSHLGDRVTALVDDALDEDEWSGVQAHLVVCERCREAVRRERHLKTRMTCGQATPAPPAALVAALADRGAVAQHVARQERRRMAAVQAAVTAGGLCASLAVVGLCAGGSSPLVARQSVGAPAQHRVASWVSVTSRVVTEATERTGERTRAGVGPSPLGLSPLFEQPVPTSLARPPGA